ncbi:MAG: nitrile hydratase subunit beta [Burkholderiaceae bacterium]
MNGGQDLGGMHGFGPVQPEPDEPVFHGLWEQRVFAMTLAMGASGQWNIDSSRHARESLPPAQYLASSYYEIWLAGLLKLMQNAGLVTQSELDSGDMMSPPLNVRCLKPEDVEPVLSRGGPVAREPTQPAAFVVGDTVETVRINPQAHTRLPRYARGRRGTIAAVHGCHVYPDSHAINGDENPQWLYSVCFDAAQLWGPDTTADAVFVDCWEPYLMKFSGQG